VNRLARVRFGAVAALCVALPVAGAQVVVGTVTERHSGTPIGGVVLSLVDTSTRTVATVLADAQGHFEIRAPAAGRFALDAKRIGVARTRTDFFDITTGERLERAIVVDQITPRLTRVVTSRTRSGLPLGRMRVQHELVEIDSTASRFD